MGVVISQTVIDCIDPEAVAAFWAAALGRRAQREESYLWMSESGDEDSFGLVLVFVAVPEVKTVKNRLHIHLARFKMSRSSRNVRFSQRNADSSSRSALVSSARWPESTSAWFTHRRTAVSVKPSSAATDDGLRPG